MTMYLRIPPFLQQFVEMVTDASSLCHQIDKAFSHALKTWEGLGTRLAFHHTRMNNEDKSTKMSNLKQREWNKKKISLQKKAQLEKLVHGNKKQKTSQHYSAIYLNRESKQKEENKAPRKRTTM